MFVFINYDKILGKKIMKPENFGRGFFVTLVLLPMVGLGFHNYDNF